MKQKPQKIDIVTFLNRTGQAKDRIESVLLRANKYKHDPDKKDRLSSQQCVWCFYTPTMAGQAFTSRECGLCGRDMKFGNTNTDAFCKDCAKEHGLCKHCGGDIKMRVRRRNWPINK